MVPSESAPSSAHAILGYVLTLAMAVYGGFFSGGYVTLLTAVFAVFFSHDICESIAATKLMNVFSSVAATAIFAWRGIGFQTRTVARRGSVRRRAVRRNDYCQTQIGAFPACHAQPLVQVRPPRHQEVRSWLLSTPCERSRRVRQDAIHPRPEIAS
jgi:hypothetical protein